MDRRDALKLFGAGSLFGLGGCAGLSEQFDGNGQPTGTDAPQSKDTPTGSGATEDADSTGTASSPNTDTGGGSGTDDGSSTTYPAKRPSGVVADVQIPSDPTQYDYPTMGSSDASVTVQFFGSYKCPYTREFVRTFLNDLVESYVTSGDIRIQFRDVAYRDDKPFLGPDAPRAARAGLAVWENNPQRYWAYFATVFESQPPERKAWATTEQLLKFAKGAGVTTDARKKVEAAIQNEQFSDRIQATTQASEKFGINSVPRLVVDGRTLSPNLEPEKVEQAIEEAVQNA